MATFYLRVRGILDLHPRRAPAVRLIRAVRPLPDNPLKIPLARDPVQITAALWPNDRVEQSAFDEDGPPPTRVLGRTTAIRADRIANSPLE